MTAITVSSGQIVSGSLLGPNDTIDVLAGGRTIGTTVADGGLQTVEPGGVATGSVIDGPVTPGAPQGEQDVDGGIANGTIVRGGQQVVNGGTAYGAVITDGGYQSFDGGSAINTVVDDGEQNVRFLRQAIGTVVNNRGEQFLDEGSTSLYTVVNAGGAEECYAGGSFGTLLNGGTENLYGGGAGDTIVNGGSLGTVFGGLGSPIIAGGGSANGDYEAEISDPTIIDGTVEVLANAELDGPVTFAGVGRLVLEQQVPSGALALDAPLVNFGHGDSLDLIGLDYTGSLSTKAVLSGSTLTVTNGIASETFTLTNPTETSFTVSADASSGVLVQAVDTRTVVTGRTAGSATLQGTVGDDLITASNVGNHIFANGGNDTIDAGKGQATVDASTGNVDVTLNGYNNAVVGGNGNDIVTGSQGNTSVTLGDGSNFVSLGGYLNDVILGDGDDDVISGRGGATVKLGDGANRVYVSEYGNTVTAGDGDNTVVGGTGNGTITLGGGKNTIVTSGLGNAITVGSGRNDVIAGSGADTVTAVEGTDTITLSGTSNKVTLTGTDATVDGGLGSDTIAATGGNDTVTFRGYKDHAILNGSVDATILDLGQELRLDVGSSDQEDVVTGFAQDRSAVVNLLNGAGGFVSTGEVLDSLRDDQSGGTTLSLGQLGSIDFVGIGRDQFQASNFKIG